MNKKKIIVLSGIVMSFLVIVIVIIMACSKEKVTIFFDVDGGSKISKMKVSVGEKVKLPTATKKGFNFEGWYLDDKKLSSKESFDKDTTITAHWIESKAETMTVTFNTDGGNKIKDMTIECDEKLKLPTPKKEGYKFINWMDKNGNEVTSKSKLTCKDLSLKAKWEKEEETKKEEIKKEEVKEDEKKEETKKEETKEETKAEEKKEEVKKEYTCPSDYTLNGDKCTKEVDAETRCGEGKTEQNGKCVTITSDARKELQKTCSNGGVLGGDYCYFDEIDVQEACDKELNSENGKCYNNKENANQSCSNGYVNITNPGNGVDGGCFPVSEKEKYCSDGFTLNNNKCVKTINATLK